MKAIISIHDCMPETMDKIQYILKWLKERHVPPVTILVVPGKNWSENQLSLLKQFTEEGHILSAHGWYHHTQAKKILHRIHSLIISKDVAEHLDLNQQGILELINKSCQWFIQKQLPAPSLYVPPAWALGAINKKTLTKTSVKQIEVTRGVIHLSSSHKPKLQTLPLTGYEADSPFRVCFLSKWNQFQQRQAQNKSLPLRISIHPYDLDLPIAEQLEQQLKSVETFLNYTDLP
jgi:predicted deacetylase